MTPFLRRQVFDFLGLGLLFFNVLALNGGALLEERFLARHRMWAPFYRRVRPDGVSGYEPYLRAKMAVFHILR